MTKENRYRYYCSREWAVKKRDVKLRSGGKCERCHFASAASVHHLTYIRFGGDELLDDLQHLCDPCHEFISGIIDNDPAESASIVLEMQRLSEAYIAILEWVREFDIPRAGLPELPALPVINRSIYPSFEDILRALASRMRRGLEDLLSWVDAFMENDPAFRSIIYAQTGGGREL